MSYGNGTGGTLTLPSPNSVHHVDVTAAVRSLRRSLSRSPSKLNITRSYSQGSDGTISTPGSPSPCRIIQRPMPPASAPQLSHPHPQANLSTPFRSGVKLSLRSGRPKAASAKPLSRASRISPKSPLKRALSNTTDSGNPVTSSSPPSSDALLGQENNIIGNAPSTASPTSRKSFDRYHSRHSMHLDVSGASNKNNFPRLFEFKALPIPSTSVSPLKRNDAFTSPDQPNIGSPVAKRRSMYGASGTPPGEPNVFDMTSPALGNFEIHEDASKEYELGTGASYFHDPPASPTPAAMPRRSESLRRSTLQQRQGEKTSWGRRQGEKHLAQIGAEAASPMAARNRPRVSLDQFVQPALPRDSPFSAQPPLPNPSLHLLERPNLQPQPHPLSRSVTTSSSNSSLPDDSPTHIPVQFERPRAPHPFAKSLPVGARPLLENGNKNAATPAYKNARPFQDAFKSTGLISKVNRNPEFERPNFGESTATMPDTPCKKPIYPSNTYPSSSGGGKGRQRHSFGSPSSPFAPGHGDSFVLGESDKVSSLFKPFQPTHARKSSIFNPDSDFDSQNLADNVEFPPTPTKSVFFRSVGNSKSVPDSPFVKTAAAVPATVSAVSFRDVRHIPDPMCKSASFSQNSVDGGVVEQTAALRGDPSSPLLGSLSSFGKSRARRGPHATPEPLRLHSTAPLMSSQKKVEFAKTAVVIVASPLGPLDKFAADSPKTPRDNNALMPPDLSSLSIPQNEAPTGTTFGSFPPATPTARQGDHFGGFADRRVSITPVNGQGPGDIDMVLKSRFDQVEMVGKGEFSQVFKVTRAAAPTTTTQNGTPGTPPTPSQAQVFAVKKTRLPFFGAKDREAKLREVNILQALRGRSHVLHYVDSWEKQFHLYIQTEYCEEGSLSGFLGTVGAAGRLDDFRIWKILVEASMVGHS